MFSTASSAHVRLQLQYRTVLASPELQPAALGMRCGRHLQEPKPARRAEPLTVRFSLQVASPLVYRLAKHVVATNVKQPGAQLYKRVQQRQLYDDVHAKVAAYLDLQPQTECLGI